MRRALWPVSYVVSVVSTDSLRLPHPLSHARRDRARWVLAALGLLLLTTALLAVGHGAVAITPEQVVAILAAQSGLTLPWEYTSQQAAVLLAIRLPRVLLAVLIGGGLAVAGAAMQGLFRNPLADPGLVGVSAGAALAAVATIVLGTAWIPGAAWLATGFSLPLAAFLGGLLTTALIYRLATNAGRTDVATLLLAGIAINAVAGAGTGLLTYMADDQQLRTLTFWSMGSLGSATWSILLVCAPLLLLAVIAITRLARALNLLLLGEAEALHLGVEIDRVKRWLVVWVALAVGAAVAAAGIIGFIGLVVPHLLRLMLGPDHRYLLPGCLLLGATLLLGADLLARTVIVPAELPIGIVTALVGGPFFIWLLLRQRRAWS